MSTSNSRHYTSSSLATHRCTSTGIETCIHAHADCSDMRTQARCHSQCILHYFLQNCSHCRHLIVTLTLCLQPPFPSYADVPSCRSFDLLAPFTIYPLFASSSHTHTHLRVQLLCCVVVIATNTGLQLGVSALRSQTAVPPAPLLSRRSITHAGCFSFDDIQSPCPM